MKNPLVTIAIPTLRRLSYLKESVAFALAQTYPNIEVLVSQDVDRNGLNPEMKAWCLEQAEQEPRFRYQNCAHNLGLAGNWNAVGQAARGEYMVITGDDDRLLPDFVERLVEKIDETTHVAFSNHYIIDGEGKRNQAETEAATVRFRRSTMPGGFLKLPETYVWQNAIPMLSALVRTEDIRRFPFSEELNTPEIELFIRIAQTGGNFYFLPEYLAEFRVHGASATMSGLRIERLVKRLTSVTVSPEVAPFKKAFLETLVMDSVTQCLLSGEIQEAKLLLANPYYPADVGVRSLMQKACLAMPDPLAKEFYTLMHNVALRARG
jgi:GT2 family glycosyltransferase